MEKDITISDLMLLLDCDTDSPGLRDMINKAKREYVNERHTRSISQMVNASGYKHGKWKTYVGDKRKEVIKNTEDEMYGFLFDYYFALDSRNKTLSEAFSLLEENKRDCLGRSMNTIKEDIRYFGFLSDHLKNKPLSEISDEDIERWLQKDYLPNKPKKAALKKVFQLLNQIFSYGIRKKLCFDNPMKYISSADYYSSCDLTKKPNEQKSFSRDELDRLEQDALKDKKNPRALMSLLAKETGMRLGELPALHKEDIIDGFIHVHRQQLLGTDKEGHEYYYEVAYTRDERLHPHDGRYIPLSEKCAQILTLAAAIPGESLYVFHDPGNAEMVSKTSYVKNLSNRCKRLGTAATNNHAFRIAFNSRLIEQGFSASDRALILGHEVQTNEEHYSLTDQRRLSGIKDRFLSNNVK